MQRSRNGRRYTETLRSFNDWFEEFMVEASRPLIMLGFIFGTVNVFTGGTELARSDVFTVSWAIVQAVSVDGLFFAVLSQLKSAKGWKRILPLGGVALSLALVAFLVNDTLSFQQVNSVSMRLAMDALGVPSVLFTHVRAGLVVAVSIASALVLERKQDFMAVVTEIVEQVQSLETDSALILTEEPRERSTETVKEVHLIDLPVETVQRDRERGEHEPEKPALRLLSQAEPEKEEMEKMGDIETYMRLHNCSRATAYRRMKKDRKEA